ncbi:MAG: hypothetical protein R2773_02210 [Flavobacteriaceae bacterium]
MNAKKLAPSAKASFETPVSHDAPLKFLSRYQRFKSNSIAKDWKSFTYGMMGEILNKI